MSGELAVHCLNHAKPKLNSIELDDMNKVLGTSIAYCASKASNVTERRSTA